MGGFWGIGGSRLVGRYVSIKDEEVSMGKVIIVFFAVIFSGYVSADIQSFGGNKIKQISAYDDYEGGIIRIEITNSHSSCPVGGFLNPNKPGFDQLYSLALVAATSQKDATIQLYTHLITAGLCEIDAIRLDF